MGVFLFVMLWLVPVTSAAEIMGPAVRTDGQGIYVSTGLLLDEQGLREINEGLQKDIDIYIDLFRIWRMWPDEFVLGVKYTQTILCDPVKKEYVATSLSGRHQRERRFKNCPELLKWALNIPEIMLTNVGELEPAPYFVKVSAESRLRRLPPFIGQLFFFVPQTEFQIESSSERFHLGGASK